MFLYGLLGTTYIFFYYLCVVYNNFIVKYQLCLNKLFSVSVSVSVSRTDFKWWVAHNRPHHGSIYNAMRMTRAQFKYALRQCRLEDRSIISTKLAYHMQSHEFNEFWKEIRKQNKAKSALSNCVAGVTGEIAIADMWRDHYE